MKNTHIDLLKQGVPTWNLWRKENQDIVPLLDDIDIRSTDIALANLSNASIKRGIFKWGKMTAADFSGSILNDAIFAYAIADDVNFSRADLRGADFSDSNFVRANLAFADLRGAKLRWVDFSSANILNTTFSSRSQLSNLRVPLSDQQMAGVFFEDEKSRSKSETHNRVEHLLRISIGVEYISPFNLSYLLLAVEATYNNLFFLTLTESDDIKEIQSHISPYFQGVSARDAIVINSIAHGSIVIDFTAFAAGAAGIMLTLSKVVQVIGSEIREFSKLKQEALDREALRRKVMVETEELQLKSDEKKLGNSMVAIDLSSKLGTLSNLDRAELDNLCSELDLSKIAGGLNFRSKVVKEREIELLKLSTQPLSKILYKYNQLGYSIGTKYEERKSTS